MSGVDRSPRLEPLRLTGARASILACISKNLTAWSKLIAVFFELRPSFSQSRSDPGPSVYRMARPMGVPPSGTSSSFACFARFASSAASFRATSPSRRSSASRFFRAAASKSRRARAWSARSRAASFSASALSVASCALGDAAGALVVLTNSTSDVRFRFFGGLRTWTSASKRPESRVRSTTPSSSSSQRSMVKSAI